jgi:hypothetical protein
VSPAARRRATRAVAGLLLGWGLLLVTRPDDVVATLAPGPDRPNRRLVQVLGARTAVQHALVLARPERRLVLGGAAVDGLHAASMVAAAAVWPRLRRAALVSGGSAAASAVLEAVAAPAASRR